jgi:TnpA family transposase
MITSLLRHDTMMTVEANCIDSHGQSELGFAFCRFLFVELLPWLKRMKNDPDVQEQTVLCLHLLQNALVLVNTVMLERVLYDGDYLYRMDEVDFNAMTALFTSNMNPYGDINLDINKPSFLEAH